jgi:N-acylneuraminate cytidylyltransferase
MRIAVIPARGGSKRIPRKNIRDFCGRPMLAWSIDAARASTLFDHVLVSTDDREIATVARDWKAEVPFVRPDELSDDHAGTTEVVGHATSWALTNGWPLSAVCCIYATAPFVQPADLRRGLDALESGDWDFAFSVTEFPSSIFRSFRQLPEGGLEMFFPEQFQTRSQDLPIALHDAGQFYWGRPDAWVGHKPIFGRRSVPVFIPHWRVQDIDSEDDWRRAELLRQVIQETA